MSARSNERWTASAIAVVPTFVWRTLTRIRPLTRTAPVAWTRSAGGCGRRRGLQQGADPRGIDRDRRPSDTNAVCTPRLDAKDLVARLDEQRAVRGPQRHHEPVPSHSEGSASYCAPDGDCYAANMGTNPNKLGEPSMTRALNQALVLDAIRRDGPTSRAALARTLALAKPTVSEIVEDLVADGLVREGVTRAVSTRGRPPVLLSFNERSEFVLGIHVGVQHTTVVVADATGAEIDRRRVATPRIPPEQALGEVGALAREVVVSAGVPRRRLSAAGVCVPGLVDVEAGTCVHAPNLGWRDVPVVGLLGVALGVPVYVHNTVHAAAAAEFLEGAGAGGADDGHGVRGNGGRRRDPPGRTGVPGRERDGRRAGPCARAGHGHALCLRSPRVRGDGGLGARGGACGA